MTHLGITRDMISHTLQATESGMKLGLAQSEEVQGKAQLPSCS